MRRKRCGASRAGTLPEVCGREGRDRASRTTKENNRGLGSTPMGRQLRTTSILCLLPLLMCGSFNVRAQAPELAQLELLLVDEYGNKISTWDKLSVQDETGKEWAGSFDESLAARLPQGIYQVEVRSFHPYEMQPFRGSILVRSPEVAYTIGMSYANLEDVEWTAPVAGRFVASEAVGATCFLTALYRPYSYFATVKESGSFRFENVLNGKYIMTCEPESTLRVKRTVIISWSSPSEIIIGDEDVDVTLDEIQYGEVPARVEN